MFVQPVDDDPIRQFSEPEEKKLTRNLFDLVKKVRAHDSQRNTYNTDLVRSWHFQLFKDVREHAGRYRSNDYGEDILNFGPHRSAPRRQVLSQLEEHVVLAHKFFLRLDDLEQNSNNASQFIYEVIKTALLLHALFIKIHPFRDGNGRVGRLVMTFTLAKYHILPLAIEVPRQEYINCLSIFYSSQNTNIDPLCELALRIYGNQLLE